MLSILLSPKQFQSFVCGFSTGREVDDCWIWNRFKTATGYGTVRVGSRLNGDRRMERAHRVSFSTYVGPIPNGLHVLHRCDNPSCVNPSHLWTGSHDDNMADKRAKGREKPNRQGDPKLTIDQVSEIRASSSASSALARKFGVSHSQINRIKRRTAWN